MREHVVSLMRWWKVFCSSKLICWVVLLSTISSSFFFVYEHGHLFHGKWRSSINGWDNTYYYFWLRCVMVDGSVDFTKDAMVYNTWDQETRDRVLFHTGRTPLGLIPNKYPVGWAFSEVPWFLAGDLISSTLDLAGKDYPLDGWGRIYQAATMLGQFFYAFWSLWFAWQIAARLAPSRYAWPVTLLTWIASPLYIYQSIHLSMSHNVLFFAVTGAYYFSLRLSDNPELYRYWAISGFFCGLTVISRYQGAVLLFYPAALWIDIIRRRPSLLEQAQIGGICFLLTLLPQLFAWKFLYGSFLVYSYTGEGFDWLHPHLWEVLFSARHGWFNWHPAMALGSIGFFCWVWSRKSLIAWCFLASYLGYLMVNASWNCWWFGASFGAREFDASTLFVMIGAVHIAGLLENRRIMFSSWVGIFLLLAFWNLNLVWIATKKNSISWGEPVTNLQKWRISVSFWSHHMH